MVKYLLCLVIALGSIATITPEAEARFGSRYASASGWRPGKVLLKIRHANADRRQARRARMFPNAFGHRQSSCAATSSAPASCSSCPSTKTTTTTTVVKDCPNGVCPIN